MQEKYIPSEVESAAQSFWSSIDAYRVIEHARNAAGDEKPKFYACSMLPYPSGKLHMGHVRNYTINDMMARQLRMKGFNVLMPMGWDAFGLPAENAAMKNHRPPAAWTMDNIEHMRAQMNALGLAIDWTREMTACDPAYYKWNQWLFLKMLERGIAYRKTQVVNWDPQDKTVLANEQVIDGRGWRTGALVEKREIPGYYLKITDFADELLDPVVDGLPGWPERVRAMQEHWIGKSKGVRFAFPHTIRDADGELVDEGKLHVFTTRADTIMGVTFCAVAAEHPLAAVAARGNAVLTRFIEECKKGGTTEAELAVREKEGVATGLFVAHPFTGEPIEVWVGNYVLMSYGDGAVMGVPGHDERDFEFARKYGLPIKQVIGVAGRAYSSAQWHDWYGDKYIGKTVHSGRYDGLSTEEAISAVAEDLAALGLGEMKTTYRLRDWGISRQRYWGTPIPIIHCPGCGAVPVPEQDLPVLLPVDLVPDGSGNPLASSREFLDCICPQCGGPGQRETDTMDTFVDSSWYYMRYCCPGNATQMVDERLAYWMPMDQYIGGIEHAVLHLLYARFWTKVMRDLGLADFDEPFTNLICQGMVLNHIYQRREASGGLEYFWPADVEDVYADDGRIVAARLKSDGSAVDYMGLGTMSKSKNNGVDPQALISQYGADTARLFVMFASPPEQTLEWNDSAVEGAHRFLRRVWAFSASAGRSAAQMSGAALGQSVVDCATPAAKALRREIHLILGQADHDYTKVQYNTVVSACMKMLNAMEDFSRTQAVVAQTAEGAAVITESLGILLRILYPVTPHITHVIWESLGFAATATLLDAPWPAMDPSALAQDMIELVVQVNGKLRGSVEVAPGADEETIRVAALANEQVARFVTGPIKKFIVVRGRLVNIVV